MTPESELLMRPHDTTNDIPYGYCHCGCGEKTKIAPYDHSVHGHVKGHPIKYIVGHTSRRPVADRFWEKVDKRGPDDCWGWTGAASKGRAVFASGGRVSTRRSNAARFSWELSIGPIPDDLMVLHKCDNPLCVNPRHLFLGTQADNMKDMSQKGRYSTPAAKLSPQQVVEIRQLHKQGMSQSEIARRYGIRREGVYKIVFRKRYKHIE